MIILYDANEKEFTSLGIGVLSDAISCVVPEELNGGYELEMEYPINGAHYSDLQETRIILAKANDTYQPQPFRIYKITKPIDGTVTVYAEHISYDTSKIPVRKFEAEKLEDICYTDEHVGALKQAEIISSPFKFLLGADKTEGTAITYKTKCPNNMRSLLMGSDESILNIYSGEFIFDRFNITLCNRRGVDRDFTIRYSKNMIDLEQETSSELMYTGVCPYYSNTTTETKVGIGKKYKEIYISKEKVTPLIDQDGNTMYPSTWLTYKSTGLEAITNILSLSVTNIIASEGEFQNHLVTAKRATPQGSTQQGSYFYDVTYNMAYLNKNNVGGQNRYWLFKDIDLTECYENEDHHVHHGEIFRIYTPSDNLYKVYVFDDSLGSDGEYRLITSEDDIKEYPPTIPSVDNTQEEKDNIIVYEGELIFVNEVRAIPKEGKTTTDVDWLQKVEEQIQVINSDPRWKVPDEGGDIIQIRGVPSKTIYKVPTTEVATMAYPIEGVKEYTREWLTLGVTSYINPNVEQYSENWLYTKDSDGNPVQIIPNDYTTYGVTIDENISYYKWIDSAYEQIELKNALPIPDEELIDGRPFNVPREDGTIYKCRWSSDDNKYNHRTDTRCTYTNYEWNGQSYVIHQTTDDKILTLDLTDKFKETPKNNQKFQKNLYDETITYIKDTKLGTLKNSIKVSFVKLSSSPEYSKWKELEKVSLGDVVHVIYEDLGVNEKKKVIKTEYNVLTETYDSIEIGDKGTGFVDTAVTQGDSVSALTNDRNFADITTVTNLVAERIEADYIHAMQAEITEAQIQTLTATELNATIVTAQKFEIDKLVASLLVADDAAIRNTLVVGENLVVNGEVNVKNGSISISGQQRINDATIAYINDAEGIVEYGTEWLLLHETDTEAQGIPVLGIIYKVEIDGVYKYYTWSLPESEEQDGHYEPVDLKEDVYFEVDESGNVTANSLTITGGSIEIEGPDDTYFAVDDEGNVTANSLTITGGTISISGDSSLFSVNQDGSLEANSVKLTGGEIENLDITGYLFFKSKEYITAYVMTSKGNTSYSDGYLAYTSDNSYMEYLGTYSYEDGVLTLTTNSQQAEYARNYISYQGGSLNYSINYFGRLSEHNPATDGKEGPALTPVLDKTYLIMDYRQGYEHTADLYGLYNWNGSEYVISQTKLYYISDDGLYLPGIKSTITDGTIISGGAIIADGAIIAGFNIDENTITSSTSTSEVGICSDSSEDYAIWAGKANNGEYPFSVTHKGYLSATSGKIADLLISSNYLTSNPDKTDHSTTYNQEGIFIDSNGITITGKIDSESSTDQSYIRIGGEYGPTTGIVAPNIFVNFKKLGPDATHVGTVPYLALRPIYVSGTEYDGVYSTTLDEDDMKYEDYNYRFFMVVSVTLHKSKTSSVVFPDNWRIDFATPIATPIDLNFEDRSFTPEVRWFNIGHGILKVRGYNSTSVADPETKRVDILVLVRGDWVS